MAEPVKPLGVGIHELLRYAIPGYSFIIVLSLPLLYNDSFVGVVTKWELFVSLFLIGGLLSGYFLYYPYYRYFRSRIYKRETRRSLQAAFDRMFGQKRCWQDVEYEVTATHTRALDKEKGRIRDSIIFQFSVFHSIGTTFLSIWAGWIGSLILALLMGTIPHLGLKFWGIEGLTALILGICSYFLITEYTYRTKLTIEIEDQVALLHLDTAIKEWREHRQ